MSDFLKLVARGRRADVAAARAWRPLEQVRRAAQLAAIRRGMLRFADTLRERRREGRLAVIAEVKRTSPALGRLAEIDDPGRLAATYVAAGAAAISVLVEPRHWGGSLDDLRSVKSPHTGVGWGIPVLAKDVIVDEYQIAEAGAAGADAVLLIAEALSDAELARLIEFTLELGMDALVEAHDPVAFELAVRSIDAYESAGGLAASETAAGAVMLAVNARDLRQPSRIDRRRIHELAPRVPARCVLVAESGISSVEDAEALPARVDAVLVGTALVRAADPAPLIRALAGVRPARSLA